MHAVGHRCSLHCGCTQESDAAARLQEAEQALDEERRRRAGDLASTAQVCMAVRAQEKHAAHAIHPAEEALWAAQMMLTSCASPQASCGPHTCAACVQHLEAMRTVLADALSEVAEHQAQAAAALQELQTSRAQVAVLARELRASQDLVRLLCARL